jgi:serine/threonine protein kinase
MPLVEGRSLDKHIHEAEVNPKGHLTSASREPTLGQSLIQGPNRYRVIARLAAEAADAIHAAHSVGVIHRDIKPSNLIVDSQGRIRVTDFGLAIDTADLALTRSGEIVGTIRYMSPEQAAGKRGLVDHRSDVYCLGATLYELLTLTPPFDSESLAEVVRRKEAGTLTPPRSIDATIPQQASR